MISRSPVFLLLAGLAAAIVAGPADARVGGGVSSGSRGGRTFSAPAPTPTAPRAAQPMQRTETPSVAPRPGYATPPAAGPSFGFGSGLMAGLLGAGLFGMLFGHGFLGGLSGFSSMIGFLFQIALVVGLAWLALRLFRGRSQPAFAGAEGPYARSALNGGPGAGPYGSGSGSGAPAGRVRDEVGIGPADYAAFERNLVEIQMAYGRDDVRQLSQLATPEMVRYFAADLDENRRQNVRNELSDVRLLQGDLAEAWREGSADYATVAMRFSLIDVTVDRGTGRVVAGNRGQPDEAREIWTFRRDRGGLWLLSAIQQTA